MNCLVSLDLSKGLVAFDEPDGDVMVFYENGRWIRLVSSGRFRNSPDVTRFDVLPGFTEDDALGDEEYETALRIIYNSSPQVLKNLRDLGVYDSLHQ